MAMFVHFGPGAELAAIKRRSLRASKHARGVYAVPATPDFYASHQSIRELRRFRANAQLMSIYFRVPGARQTLRAKDQRAFITIVDGSLSLAARAQAH